MKQPIYSHWHRPWTVSQSKSIQHPFVFQPINFGYQLWCLFGYISNVLINMFNVGLIIM